MTAIPIRYAKLHPTSRGDVHRKEFEDIQRLHAAGQSAARVEEYLEGFGYKPLRNDLEKSHTDIMRVSRQTYNEAKAVLYQGKKFTALIEKAGLRLCDQDYRTPWMKGTATERRRALHEHPGDLTILVPSIKTLELFLYFESGKGHHRELIFSICTLANALAASGSLKQLILVVRVPHDGYEQSKRLSAEDVRILEGLLVHFELLRNLDAAEFIVEGWDDWRDEPSALSTSPEFESNCDSWQDRLCSNETVTEMPTYPKLFLEYCQNYWYLFEEMREGFADGALLDEAWCSCIDGDLETLNAVLKETKAREEAVFHKKAGIRLRR